MKTLPISLVYVFVAVAQRIGMEASPINYPGRVLARVSLANSPDCVFVDVFGSLSTQNPLRLRTVDIESTSDLGRAAHAAPMLIRATHNIAASLQLVDQAMMNALKPAEFASAIYAMRVARWLLSDPAVDPDRLLGLIGQYYPLDLVAVGALRLAIFFFMLLIILSQRCAMSSPWSIEQRNLGKRDRRYSQGAGGDGPYQELALHLRCRAQFFCWSNVHPRQILL